MRMAEGDTPTGVVTGPWAEKTETEVDAGFEFAFDNKAFSDRVMRIEVVGTSHKRRRYKAKDNDGEGIESACVVMGTPVLRVKSIHVSSMILAARSSFFFKLFSNGMKKTGQRQSTLRIADSEENAFMELLRFMYNGKLTPTTESTLLVDILMVADKFDVPSCIKLCGQRLIGLPMTVDLAVKCLDLPCSISMAADLSEAAKKFLSKRYEKFLSTKFQDELMRIPLAWIVAILSRNHPGVASEESVYEFVLRWAELQYPSSEERHKILSSSLLPLVTLGRIMTSAILIDQSSCIINFRIKREDCCGLFPSGSIDSPPFYCAGHGFFLSALGRTKSFNSFGLLVKKLQGNVPLRGAIDYQMEVMARRSSEFASISRRATTTDTRQAFGCRIPWSEIIADDSPFFVDDKLHLIKREDCCGLFPSGSIDSPPFYCAGHGFFLSALGRTKSFNSFGLLVKKLQGNVPLRGAIDYQMEVMARRSSEFASISRRATTTDTRQAFGCRIPWSEIIADDSPFFVDDKLHLQVRMKITPRL